MLGTTSSSNGRRSWTTDRARRGRSWSTRSPQGRDVILEIDVKGADQVRAEVPDALLIFLAPPSMDELERRLRGRGTEDDERIARRLETAAWEMTQRDWFDHVVVNDDLERAADEVAAIIDASRTGRCFRPP